jgi:hypothetical protein
MAFNIYCTAVIRITKMNVFVNYRVFRKFYTFSGRVNKLFSSPKRPGWFSVQYVLDVLFPDVKRPTFVKLTTHLLLVLRLRMSAAMPQWRAWRYRYFLFSVLFENSNAYHRRARNIKMLLTFIKYFKRSYKSVSIAKGKSNCKATHSPNMNMTTPQCDVTSSLLLNKHTHTMSFIGYWPFMVNW